MFRYIQLAVFAIAVMSSPPSATAQQDDAYLVSGKTFQSLHKTMTFNQRRLTTCSFDDGSEFIDIVERWNGRIEEHVIVLDQEELGELLSSGFCDIAPFHQDVFDSIMTQLELSLSPDDSPKARKTKLNRIKHYHLMDNRVSTYVRPRKVVLTPMDIPSEAQVRKYQIAYEKCEVGFESFAFYYYDCSCFAKSGVTGKTAFSRKTCLSNYAYHDFVEHGFGYLNSFGGPVLKKMPKLERVRAMQEIAECGARDFAARISRSLPIRVKVISDAKVKSLKQLRKCKDAILKGK